MTTGTDSNISQSHPIRIAHYRIVRKLGQGGMSIVYEGFDERLKRPVALKILHPFLAERFEYRTRFLREAEAVARLTNPNIVQIFDVSHSESDQLYIVTELLVGETLRDFFNRFQFIDAPELSALIIWEIAGALEHAHKRGIIHRDIKPENIMICRDGQIKLMDFGIASIGSEESLTQSGTLMGSLAHLSPEVIKGQKATYASDIFSLTTVFYWLLSDRLPFQGDSPHAVLKAIVDVDAKKIQTLSPFVSDDLAMVVEKGMKKNPEARFSSAQAMCEAIEHSLSMLGVSIDIKQLHVVLRDPDEKLNHWKIAIFEHMKQKLVVYQQEKQDAHAMALECRLGAITPPKPASLPPRKRRAELFAATSVIISLALGVFAYSWWITRNQPIDASLPVEVNILPEVLASDQAPQETDPPPPPLEEEKVEALEVVAPTPKAPVFRSVEVVVWPFATISVDGRQVATDAKSVVLKLEVGTHKLTFSHAYAATVEKVLKVKEGQTPIEVHVALDKSKPAFLVVKSNIDSDVAVDGSYRGGSRKSLTKPIVIPMPDKSHAISKEVIISQDNYVPFIVETEFVAGQTKEIEVSLKPIAKANATTLEAEPQPALKKLYQ